MKKHLSFLFIIPVVLLAVLLSGCGYEGTFPYSRSKSDVIQIELVEAKSGQSYKLLYTISEEDQDEFLTQFEGLPFYEYVYGPPLGVGGQSVRIVYSDNSYDITNGAWSEYCYYSDGSLKTKSTCLHSHKNVFHEFLNEWISELDPSSSDSTEETGRSEK